MVNLHHFLRFVTTANRLFILLSIMRRPIEMSSSINHRFSWYYGMGSGWHHVAVLTLTTLHRSDLRIALMSTRLPAARRIFSGHFNEECIRTEQLHSPIYRWMHLNACHISPFLSFTRAPWRKTAENAASEQMASQRKVFFEHLKHEINSTTQRCPHRSVWRVPSLQNRSFEAHHGTVCAQRLDAIPFMCVCASSVSLEIVRTEWETLQSNNL